MDSALAAMTNVAIHSHPGALRYLQGYATETLAHDIILFPALRRES